MTGGCLSTGCRGLAIPTSTRGPYRNVRRLKPCAHFRTRGHRRVRAVQVGLDGVYGEPAYLFHPISKYGPAEYVHAQETVVPGAVPLQRCAEDRFIIGEPSDSKHLEPWERELVARARDAERRTEQLAADSAAVA